MINEQKLRAIDLYSGVGGWSLGLQLAGIDVVASFEWWDVANHTNQMNNRHTTTTLDIRQLEATQLPSDIEFIVGSPPCTQFSFSNRGGKGDIEEGLIDVAKFLEMVAELKPRSWAMENVPRVAHILRQELGPAGRLRRFAHLKPNIEIFDMQQFGLPQSRQRCIAGNFDFGLLNSYAQCCPRLTLGDVIANLSRQEVRDTNYGIKLPYAKLSDHEIEEFLNPEEERMNREAKTYHSVYNNMAFPDRMDRPVRTITATCTRVSRESIVVAAPEKKGKYRRLTVRERACLQGFPVTFQFYGDSYTQKLKMIGNAIPPLFTFYVGQAMLGIPADRLKSPQQAIRSFLPPKKVPKKTQPDRAGKTYPETRKFRSAIPNLRLKSGVRFDFANHFSKSGVFWKTSFFFGSSKNIQEIEINSRLHKEIMREKSLAPLRKQVAASLSRIGHVIESTDARSIQAAWAHKQQHGITPFDIVDILGESAGEIIELLAGRNGLSRNIVMKSVVKRFSEDFINRKGGILGLPKVLKHADAILAGFLVGTTANLSFSANKNKKEIRDHS